MAGFSETEQRHFESAHLELGTTISATLRLGPGGRVVIPADMREAMGLKQGDALIAKLSGGELSMVTLMGTVRQLHALVKDRSPAAVSLVDEFIRDKRAEAAKDCEE